MTTQTVASHTRRRWILAGVGLPVLVSLWWAFRPEKLWIDEKVNEPAPFETSRDPQPILTGRFETKTQPTSGRATIYRKSGVGEYVRLSDFTSPDAPDLHVALVPGDDANPLRGIDLGPLKKKQGDQSYDLPPATDLTRYDAVAIYSGHSQTVLGLAKLEPF